MAETKRVNDQYKITSPTIIIDGNLRVLGSTTTVETTNSAITDNIIVLNSGETGVGITQGTSGIQIDRGQAEDVKLVFSEADYAWKFETPSAYLVVKGATPVDPEDFATKGYVDSGVGVVPGGIQGSVQYKNLGALAGDSNFVWDSTSLFLQDLIITTGSISATSTNGDLSLAANGTGTIYVKNVLKLENEITDPTAVIGSNLFYAKTPGNAGSGLYFSNTTASDELVSKKKAILFGLIF